MKSTFSAITLSLISLTILSCKKESKNDIKKSSSTTYVAVNHESSDFEMLGESASEFESVWVSFYSENGEFKYKLQAKDGEKVITEVGSCSSKSAETTLTSNAATPVVYSGEFKPALKTFTLLQANDLRESSLDFQLKEKEEKKGHCGNN